MAMLPPASSPTCAILPAEGSLHFSLVQLWKISLRSQAHFVAAFAQAGGLSMQQIRESSGEPFHQQG